METSYQLTQIPGIETERLILRALNEDDVNDVFEYARVPEVAGFVMWDVHKSPDDSLSFINFAKDQFRSGSSIIWGLEVKNDHKLIGTIDIRGLSSSNSCGEIGYVISEKYWNKGYSTEALKAVLEFGFSKLKFNRLEAHCEEENKASWHVMEKAGMKYEGTLRQKAFFKDKFRSMKMYSLLYSEWNER